MKEFGIILKLKDQVITIDHDTLPMRDITKSAIDKEKRTRFQQPCQLLEPNSTEKATQCEVRILDANYKKADLPAVVKTYTHLSQNKQATRGTSRI
jgi:hypothetical protein